MTRLFAWMLALLILVMIVGDSQACGRGAGLFRGRHVLVTRQVQRERVGLFPRLFRAAPTCSGCPSSASPTIVVPPVVVPPVVVPPKPGKTKSASFEGDGLDEVNAKRIARGLRPFIRDDGLTQAALSCASYRARFRLFGHTGNDFQFLPSGCSAGAAGCAAYPPSYGWLSCCENDNCTFAGAAWVMGDDGRRYMHLFTR